MKTKSFVIACAALLCAVGSTFASMFTVIPDYVNVLYANDTNFTCSTILVAPCNGITTNACRVTIQGFTPRVWEDKLSETTCANVLHDNRVTAAFLTKPRTIVAVN
jgi:hypothetical protein